MDMIAYVAPGDPIDVDVIKNTASLDLYNAYLNASQTYVPSLSIVDGFLIGGTSDHASFWFNGFKAIFPFEDSDQYSPYI
ncbi:MAG: aminopeptidase, partial [Aliifodinibius sp.]|nr:aminopeptidase [Fodinibius sp.]NIW49320.1 aminopeptidase [Gammaproteobacteria bacterium]NIX59099.1 aminopeptidase [candidate division Zixibacteria bacterium]NIY29737.1 aminopeptidase [Fodinibius sp.]